MICYRDKHQDRYKDGILISPVVWYRNLLGSSLASGGFPEQREGCGPGRLLLQQRWELHGSLTLCEYPRQWLCLTAIFIPLPHLSSFHPWRSWSAPCSTWITRTVWPTCAAEASCVAPTWPPTRPSGVLGALRACWSRRTGWQMWPRDLGCRWRKCNGWTSTWKEIQPHTTRSWRNSPSTDAGMNA